MMKNKKIKVAINGYGVIGKRVADALQLQEDVKFVGVCDVISDWRIKIALKKKLSCVCFIKTIQ
jgi:glyceraldehyde-3-phosphate dehydrogenase (NAD(P))